MVYVLALCSADRHDLLKRTLDSFFHCAEQYPRRVYILEDSAAPKPEWLSAPEWRARNIEWITNGRRMGQAYSIARLIDVLGSQDIERVFWSEDDWNFNQQGFLKSSFDILDKHPEIIQVSLRGTECNGHPLVNDPRFPFKVQQPGWREGWGGWSFNPSAMRLSDLKRIRPALPKFFFKHGLSFELELSREHVAHDHRIAALPFPDKSYKPYISHLGGGRSRAVEPLPAPLPTILIAVPASRRLDYGRFQSDDSPQFDAKTNWQQRGYGTGIHWDRDNDQVQAVRETWAKDIAAYPNVTLKFFYGQGQPITDADSIQLDVEDDYEHLIEKMRAICKWAKERHFDFVFKCDTDTAVNIDRLVREIIERPELEYGGYLNVNVCTGGPGYVLSRRAIDVVSAMPRLHGFAEDVNTAMALRRADIKPTMLSGHRAGGSSHFVDIGVLSEPDVVTGHAVFPNDMRKWYAQKQGLAT